VEAFLLDDCDFVCRSEARRDVVQAQQASYGSGDSQLIVIPKGYRLALTVQGKDFGYGPSANIVRAMDSGEWRVEVTALNDRTTLSL
jgi:hypothetical protein